VEATSSLIEGRVDQKKGRPLIRGEKQALTKVASAEKGDPKAKGRGGSQKKRERTLTRSSSGKRMEESRGAVRGKFKKVGHE